MSRNNVIRFLPAFVGSKAYWVDRLQKYQDSDIVELFAGSAVLSANLGKTAILNDLDPIICKILNNFEQLIIPEAFSREDYYEKRRDPEWWKYAWVFQKCSFSGVFRYSKNGYNVPYKETKLNIPELKEEYQTSLNRWKELKPTILNCEYYSLDKELIKNKVVISDPPYQLSQASYNSKPFNYDEYWKIITIGLPKTAKTIIVFDRIENLKKQNLPIIETRKMRVNGKKQGGTEALAIWENGQWLNNL